jgi:hypothetical protein
MNDKLSYTVDITAAVAFFMEHAGFSYPKAAVSNPQLQYAYKLVNAQNLACAELEARARGYTFKWSYEGTTDEEFRDTYIPYLLLRCFIYTPEGAIAGSLAGIDLGPAGMPYNEPYARVVEAELALEHVNA